MLRVAWFLLRAGLLAAAIVWVARRPGTVEIEWQGYIVETSTGVVLAALAVFLFLYTQAYRLWRLFAAAPDAWRRYRRARRVDLGYRDVTAGLVAVAAGDAAAAQKHARRARAALPAAPLARLLEAQAHLLGGNAPRARLAFAELLDDQGAAFLGAKGLLLEALAAGDRGGALSAARRAEALEPRRGWIVRTLFDLEARGRQWKKAGAALKKGVRLGAFSAAEAASHRQALLLAEAEEAEGKAALRLAAEAFAANPGFAPAGLKLARLEAARGKRRRAVGVIEKAYAASPHPALAALWMDFAPSGKKGGAASPYDEGKEALDWARRLHGLAPRHRESSRMLGLAALSARRWREARELLTAASDFRALARLEIEEARDEGKARAWLEEAAAAPPEPRWLCGCCGHAAADWRPLCARCGAFNAASWAVPVCDIRELPAPEGVAAGPEDVLTAIPGRISGGGAL